MQRVRIELDVVEANWAEHQCCCGLSLESMTPLVNEPWQQLIFCFRFTHSERFRHQPLHWSLGATCALRTHV